MPRVLVKKEHRGKDLGKKIMKKSIDQIKKDPLEKKIEISAENEFVKNNESKNINKIPDALNSKTFKLFFIKKFLNIKLLWLLTF